MRVALDELVLLWSQFTWRHWRRSPWKTVLLTGILALGVAVFFSIRLANRAAVAGFQLFSESVTGTSDLVLTSASGELPAALLPEMRRALGDIPAGLFPVLESTATQPTAGLEGFQAEALQVIGVDLVALSNIVYLDGEAEHSISQSLPDNAEVSGAPPIFPSSTLASKLNWSEGDHVSLVFDDTIHECFIAGLLPTGDFEIQQPDNLLVMDLPDLQRMTAQVGKMHRVEVRLPPGHWQEAWRDQARTRLTTSSEGRWLIETPDQQRETGGTMTQAFRLNLSILSCLALIVGVYLILQALEAAVVRRRPEIATLRALGVSPNAIRRAWQVEAMVMGGIGTLVGLLLGWLMAQVTVRAIAQTVNALYYNNTTKAAAWHWNEALLAGALGVLASAVAGWLPAKDASETPPAQMLQRGTRSDGIRLFMKPWLGVVLIILAAIAHVAPPWRTPDSSSIPIAGYASAFLWVAGAGILSGALFPVIARLANSLDELSPGLHHAASQLRQATGRHRLATAGLVVAVAMAGGMSILVGSFETTVTRWLDNVMKADLFIACQGTGNASSRNRIQSDTWQTLKADPAVGLCEVSQYYRITFEGRPTVLVGVDLHTGERSMDPIWLITPPATLPEGAEEEWGVMSEPFAYRFNKNVGDVINIPTPYGPQKVKLVGIFADYGNEFGSVVVSRQSLNAWYKDDRAARMAVQLRSDADLSEVQARWMQAHPGIVVTNNRQLRSEAIRIFRQTFAVTHGLKWIGVFVALAGLALALASMLMERQRELATLRALGFGQREIGQTTAWESLGLATVGLIVGFLLSVVLGHLIVYVINRQAFGWTLIFDLPLRDFALLAIGVLAISALVGYLTGSRSMNA
ncbi:MAG: putative ABC transport system permease protein [Verrucomicrobiales bacterium]|jgi:putative ABC transport system permease protein